MIGYVYNDGGRRAAGFKGNTGDCVPRAIAIVTGQPYIDVYKTMAAEMKANGYAASGNAYATTKPKAGKRKRGQLKAKDVQHKVKAMFGLTRVKLPKGPRPTYSQAFDTYGPCLVGTTHHVAAVVDGALHDLFDGRTYKMETGFCDMCEPSRGVMLGVGSGKCGECGEQSELYFYEATRERKAQSVWIPAS